MVKASACNAGDLDSIPGSGRSPGGGNGNPLQYSCLENPRDGGAWWATVRGVTKSQTRLSDFSQPVTQCTVGENVRWSSPVENSTQFSQKIKIELPLDPAVSFLGIYPKKMKKLSAAHRSKTSGSSCTIQVFFSSLTFLQGRRSANKTGNDPVGPLDIGPFSSLFCPLVEQQNRTVRTATTKKHLPETSFLFKEINACTVASTF